VDKLLVALDVDSRRRALELAGALAGIAGGFKVGSQLFTLEGPDLVRTLVARGARVFLDLKYHDIPNTVAQAVAAAVHTGAWMVNLHASGGIPMMEEAIRAGRETAERVEMKDAARAPRIEPRALASTSLVAGSRDGVNHCTSSMARLRNNPHELARMTALATWPFRQRRTRKAKNPTGMNSTMLPTRSESGIDP